MTAMRVAPGRRAVATSSSLVVSRRQDGRTVAKVAVRCLVRGTARARARRASIYRPTSMLAARDEQP